MSLATTLFLLLRYPYHIILGNARPALCLVAVKTP
jgi:hypothetical protein